MSERFDVIVVGGGSSGCVVAARLSEDPSRRVLLLEAGPDPDPLPPLIGDAARVYELLLSGEYLERYPVARLEDGSARHLISGRVMGGGSSVNIMAAVRPFAADMASWAAEGNPEWSWPHVLPVLKRIEDDDDFGAGDVHGSGGPIYIKRPTTRQTLSPLPAALVEAGAKHGLPWCPDVNMPEPFGIGVFPRAVKDGKRQSMVVTHLQPARARRNLEIRSGAHVDRLELDSRVVRGVRYRAGGVEHAVSADTVVLCAGAYRTPQILMLSGIGPEAELQRHGIAVRHALAGVGANFHDHATVFVNYMSAADATAGASGPATAVILARSSPDRPCADLHLLQRAPIEIEGVATLLGFSVHLLEQRRRGRVFLTSADPTQPPGVDPQTLADDGDAKAIADGMALVERLVRTSPLSDWYGDRILPAPEQDFVEYARTTVDSYYHGVGTCKMGPRAEDGAVVSQRLKVHGLDNLWIADASVMPSVTHGNTNLTCVVIAERLAELLTSGGARG